MIHGCSNPIRGRILIPIFWLINFAEARHTLYSMTLLLMHFLTVPYRVGLPVTNFISTLKHRCGFSFGYPSRLGSMIIVHRVWYHQSLCSPEGLYLSFRINPLWFAHSGICDSDAIVHPWELLNHSLVEKTLVFYILRYMATYSRSLSMLLACFLLRLQFRSVVCRGILWTKLSYQKIFF